MSFSRFFQWSGAAWIYTLAFFVGNGYQFGGGDQAEHLPALLQRWYPSLYSGDYFLQHLRDTASFDIRSHYVSFLALIAQDHSLAWWCFGLTVICLWLGVWAVMEWSARMMPTSLLTPFVAPLFTHFLFFHYWSLGDNLIAENAFVSGTPALAAGLWSLAWLSGVKVVQAGIAMAVAGWFHLLLGLHLLLMGIIYLFLARPLFWKRKIFLWLIPFLLLNGFDLWTLYQDRGFSANTCEGLSYGDYFIRYRLAHHFVISSFPFNHFLKFGFLVAMAFVLVLGPGVPLVLRNWSGMVGTVTAGCVAYYGLTEVAGLEAIFRTQWPKTTIWASAGASLMIAGVAGKMCEDFLSYRLRIWIRWIIPSLVLGAATFKEPPESCWPWEKQKDPLSEMHRFIRLHTPQDALFLVDPTNDRFSYEARRPLLIGYRAVWPQPTRACSWFKDFSTVFRIPYSWPVKEKLIDRASRAFREGKITLYTQDRQAAYVLARRTDDVWRASERLKAIMENSQYVLYEVQSGADRP
ncbi:MAG: hypothetical protein N2110_01285 [Flavobacteriales bacterium]|nr:hypothetical protein [Flavobacteriales bacterium]MCX7767643.1 hypothetical protein [Flavobacteriales bacterium]MDW8409515.1 hypothetical protein [Flavobacteriales bacterium]